MQIPISGYAGNIWVTDTVDTSKIVRIEKGMQQVYPTTPFKRGLVREAIFISFRKGPETTYTYDAPNHRDRVYRMLKQQWEQAKNG